MIKNKIESQDVIDAIKSIDIEVDWNNNNLDADLFELGLDSLDFYNFLIILEEKTGITVSDEEISELNTINNIVKFFNK
jgi:Phosphopantetheine attachment site.